MRKLKRFAIDLVNHRDAPAPALIVIGAYIQINHRGDLLIHENDVKIICAVKTGGWFSVRELGDE